MSFTDIDSVFLLNSIKASSFNTTPVVVMRNDTNNYYFRAGIPDNMSGVSSSAFFYVVEKCEVYFARSYTANPSTKATLSPGERYLYYYSRSSDTITLKIYDADGNTLLSTSYTYDYLTGYALFANK